MPHKILIMGLPRSGKTTLARAVAPLLRAVHFEHGEGRGTLNGENPDFTRDDHTLYARHMGQLCDQVVKAGHNAVADFICPTPEARLAFGKAYTVFLNTGEPVPYAQTRALFVPPYELDYEVRQQNAGFYGQKIAERLICGGRDFDWRKPTALVCGRFPSFKNDDRAVVLEALARIGQVCIAVCGVEDVEAGNSIGLMTMRERIEIMLAGYLDKIAIIGLPSIAAIIRGRDTGPTIEYGDLAKASQSLLTGGARPFSIVEIIDTEKESAVA